MPLFAFSKHAAKLLQKLPQDVQKRIMEKLRELKDHPDFFSIVKAMRGTKEATHRIRVGHYRLIIRYADENLFEVVDIGHRKEIYR